MIKVTVGEQKTQESKFPKLMKSNVSNYIVLFFQSGKGISLSGSGFVPVGEVCYTWDMSYFTDYNLPITLQNETS